VTVREPVLVMAFNRPDHLSVLLDRLREVQPERLYVAIDGARAAREGEADRVQACRDLVATVDWPCEVHTLFQDTNLGCGLGVSTAISWLFENEERGIILEDDIIPDPSFFPYCEELLERYEHDDRVFAISGCNLVPPDEQSRPDLPYRFSQVPHIWGWATWRRTWQQHRLDIRDWRQRLPARQLWERSGRSVPGALAWAGTFHMLARGEVDTWDGQLVLASMASGQWTATSNVNLTENIGFGDDATHTQNVMEDLRPVESVQFPLLDVPVELDSKADDWTRREHFRATGWGMTMNAARYVRMRLGART